jgi:hypothetical protein
MFIPISNSEPGMMTRLNLWNNLRWIARKESNTGISGLIGKDTTPMTARNARRGLMYLPPALRESSSIWNHTNVKVKSDIMAMPLVLDIIG